jgi:hypothetical protein
MGRLGIQSGDDEKRATVRKLLWNRRALEGALARLDDSLVISDHTTTKESKSKGWYQQLAVDKKNKVKGFAKVSFNREPPIVKGVVLQESKSNSMQNKSNGYGTFFNLAAPSMKS